jgi:hypothetical protein
MKRQGCECQPHGIARRPRTGARVTRDIYLSFSFNKLFTPEPRQLLRQLSPPLLHDRHLGNALRCQVPAFFPTGVPF